MRLFAARPMVRLLQRLQVVEFFVNLISGLVYIFQPAWLLGFLREPLSDHESFIWSMFGTVVVSQGVVLLSGGVAPRGPGGVRARRVAYWTLVVGELLIVPLAYRYVSQFGTWDLSAYGFVYSMALLCLARLVALLAFPDSFKD